VMRDLATVAIVGVSDPVWGRGSSQRADAKTGIWGQIRVWANCGPCEGGEGLPPGSMLLAASRCKAVELVDEILRNISLFHRTERKDAHDSVETEELLVEVGPAQKAWMSGTGLEQVKPEERWQRSSDPARGILAATQRGRDRGGEGKGATWGGGSSAETVQVIGRRGQDLQECRMSWTPEQVGSRAMLAAGNRSAGSVAR